MEHTWEETRSRGRVSDYESEGRGFKFDSVEIGPHVFHNPDNGHEYWYICSLMNSDLAKFIIDVKINKFKPMKQTCSLIVQFKLNAYPIFGGLCLQYRAFKNPIKKSEVISICNLIALCR